MLTFCIGNWNDFFSAVGLPIYFKVYFINVKLTESWVIKIPFAKNPFIEMLSYSAAYFIVSSYSASVCKGVEFMVRILKRV